MRPEFTAPDFMLGNSVEEIHRRMMESLPADIDDMPGGFPYDFTMPAAIEKSELINFTLMRALMVVFPQYAWGEWLDLHGSQAGLIRHEPVRASGYLTIRGMEGTEIPKGSMFCVPAKGDAPAVCFAADEIVKLAKRVLLKQRLQPWSRELVPM